MIKKINYFFTQYFQEKTSDLVIRIFSFNQKAECLILLSNLIIFELPIIGFQQQSTCFEELK
jgi:hypothetical protein